MPKEVIVPFPWPIESNWSEEEYELVWEPEVWSVYYRCKENIALTEELDNEDHRLAVEDWYKKWRRAQKASTTHPRSAVPPQAQGGDPAAEASGQM